MSRLILHVTISCITFVTSVCLTSVRNWLKREHSLATKVERQVSELDRAKTADEQELLEIFHNYGPAQTRHDAAFFERVEATEFMLFLQDGKSLTRQQDIQLMNDSQTDIVYKNDVTSMSIDGNAAVIQSRMTATYANGLRYSWPSIDVCVRRDGRWQILSTTSLNNSSQ